jgi:predicted SprT family Zn-dependent metalloprotease
MATIFIDTFPHEMAHLLHYLNDEKDFNKNPHGKKWKKYMKRIKKLLLLKEVE